MPVISLLLGNWRLFVAVGLIVTGWYSHSVWDGYRAEKAENKAVTSLGRGEVAIVKVHQELNDDKAFKADDCAGRTMPSSVIKLLK